MIDWLNKMFRKDRLKSAADTKYYIEKYKDFDKVIKTYYQAKDHNGKLVNIDGIVNPLKIDNRQLCSVPENQGSRPHCAAFSICNICEAIIWKNTGKLINLDADQVYAKAKELEGNLDDGTYLEYAIKAAFQLGGFDAKGIKINSIYNDGTDATVEMLKFLIHKYDFLHVGFQVFEGMYSCNSRDYIAKFTGRSLGGHAMAAVGYTEEGLILQNSWGVEFGAKSFCIARWEDVKKHFMYACYIDLY